MVDKQPPPNTSRSNSKPIPIKVKAAAAILAAAMAVSPFTRTKESTQRVAYLDPAKIPTICTGHTKGVHMGQVASDKECEELLIQDQIAHGNDVIRPNPELVDNPHGLEAAIDFAFNTGGGAWASSPMSAYSKAGQKNKACLSYIGYYTGATYSKPQRGLKCVPHPGKPGMYKCELRGLVTRRLEESKICLGTYKM
jgi:lysozyme